MDAGICPFLFRKNLRTSLTRTGGWPAQAAAARRSCLVMWPKMSKQTHATLAGLVGNILECKSLTATQLSAYTSLKRQRRRNTHLLHVDGSLTQLSLSLSLSSRVIDCAGNYLSRMLHWAALRWHRLLHSTSNVLHRLSPTLHANGASISSACMPCTAAAEHSVQLPVVDVLASDAPINTRSPPITTTFTTVWCGPRVCWIYRVRFCSVWLSG